MASRTHSAAWSLLAFHLTGGLVLLFAFLTVHRQPATRVEADPGATRSFNTIMWWHERGYLASGGLIALKTSAPPGQHGRVFYRSSSGGYMVSGYVIEKIALTLTGRYSWKLLAVHNQLLMLVTSALLALLVFRAVRTLGITSRDSFCLAVASQSVFLTFPAVLAQYWELSAQAAAIPFAILFLLFENRLDRAVAGRLAFVGQPASAFLLVYLEPLYGICFLSGYALFGWLVGRRPLLERRLLMTTIAPAALAFALVAGQIGWAQTQFPEMPFQGSGFLFRTGLDGSTEYYADHGDIVWGRDLARKNFPFNREYLFKWPAVFAGGSLAVVMILAAAERRKQPGIIVPALVSLISGYVLYAALFSQAVVIHPYLYDSLLFTPLAMALFGFAPAIIDARWPGKGLIILVTLILAVWCSFVQLRHYAMWYPTSPPAAAAGISAMQLGGHGQLWNGS